MSDVCRRQGGRIADPTSPLIQVPHLELGTLKANYSYVWLNECTFSP